MGRKGKKKGGQQKGKEKINIIVCSAYVLLTSSYVRLLKTGKSPFDTLALVVTALLLWTHSAQVTSNNAS